MEDRNKVVSLVIKLKIANPHSQAAPPPPRIVQAEDYELEEGELPPDGLEKDQLQPPLLREEEDESFDEDSSKKITCNVCYRTFGSGKALGGHKRIHNKGKPTTAKRPDSPDSEALYLQDQPHSCKFCSKVFPSEKSLHGHMRSHPERRFRGMNPPVGNEDDSGPSQAMVLLGGLPRWNTTGKRAPMLSEKRALELGMDDSPPESSSCSSGCSDEDQVAVRNLLFLRADLEDRREKRPPMHREVETVILEDGTVVNLDEYDGDELYFMQDYFRISVTCLPSHLLNKPLLPRVLGLKREMKKAEISTNDQKKKRKLNREDHEAVRGGDDVAVVQAEAEAEAEEEVDVVNKYKCSTCGKSFATHQALGGHRSSHNKDKASHSNPHPIANIYPSHPLLTLAQTRTPVDHGSMLTLMGPGSDSGSGSGVINGNAADMTMTEEGMVRAVESTSSPLHQCYLCKMTFPSGQALGGHMRCHFVRLTETTEAPPAESSVQAARAVLEFDLNEPAEEEDVNGVIDSTNSHLS